MTFTQSDLERLWRAQATFLKEAGAASATFHDNGTLASIQLEPEAPQPGQQPGSRLQPRDPRAVLQGMTNRLRPVPRETK